MFPCVRWRTISKDTTRLLLDKHFYQPYTTQTCTTRHKTYQELRGGTLLAALLAMYCPVQGGKPSRTTLVSLLARTGFPPPLVTFSFHLLEFDLFGIFEQPLSRSNLVSKSGSFGPGKIVCRWQHYQQVGSGKNNKTIII